MKKAGKLNYAKETLPAFVACPILVLTKKRRIHFQRYKETVSDVFHEFSA